MTEKFISRVYYPERFATEDDYWRLDLIESYLQLIDEGYLDTRIITRMTNTTSTSILELLDRVKTFLVNMAAKTLSILNNLIVNNVKM